MHTLLSVHQVIQGAPEQTQAVLYFKVTSTSPGRGPTGKEVLLGHLCSISFTPLSLGAPHRTLLLQVTGSKPLPLGHSLLSHPPKPLRSFSLLLSGWTLTLCPPTNGLCCQLFCSICSRSKCAQREGFDFRSQMQVSKINGPLTLPPWATYPRAASVELCSVALSLFVLSSMLYSLPWHCYVPGIPVFARPRTGDVGNVGRKKKSHLMTWGHVGTVAPRSLPGSSCWVSWV